MVSFAGALLALYFGVAPILLTSSFTVRELCSPGCTLPAHSTSTRMEGSSMPTDSVASTSSLAGPFVIECETNATDSVFVCTKITETSIDRETFSSEGGQAWAALHHAHRPENTHIKLQVQWEGPKCTVKLIPEDAEIEASLLATLSRILVQWSIASRQEEVPEQIITFQFPREDQPCSVLWSDSAVASSLLYPNIQGEMVEMVGRTGTVLGRVPRKLVHQHNLLHRGIGIFVTQDHPMDARPDLYTHRRTETKRIFPSLYDMFVGGVSLAGEDAVVTARREVEEELGLSCSDHLHPERLLQCVVCTAYNRCVVDLFVYVMNTREESVKWQDEEVAWGSFVPYKTIEAAADRSIQRLAERGEWPGRNPPIQSSRMGELDPQDQTTDFVGATEWALWDFVPDGLLVWEAWLRHSQKSQQ